MMNNKLSIKKTKEQQDELWNLIYKMKKKKKKTSKKRKAKSLVPKIRKLLFI